MSTSCKISPFFHGTIYEWHSGKTTSFKPLDEFVASCPSPSTKVEISHLDGDVFDLYFVSAESIRVGTKHCTQCVFKDAENNRVKYRDGKCDFMGVVAKSLKAFTEVFPKSV